MAKQAGHAMYHGIGSIATHVRDRLSVPGWWCRRIAVGYERTRGLRERREDECRRRVRWSG